MNYCIEHQKSDVLVTGIAQHENPYKENKSYCSSGSGEKLHLVHYREPITKWNKQSCKCREHYNYLKFRKKEIFTYHWNLYMKKKMENSINTDFCRICQIYVSEEKLVSPCHCKGSVASVHLSCLEKWLNLSNIDTCELCQYKFQIKHVKKSFIDWLKTPTTLAEKKHLLFDVVTLLALSMFTLISARICMAGASYYLERSTTNKHVILEACGLILLTVLLCIVYICWVVIALRYHFRVWCQWRKLNLYKKVIISTKFVINSQVLQEIILSKNNCLNEIVTISTTDNQIDAMHSLNYDAQLQIATVLYNGKNIPETIV
ncbi:E3 ubiquitin-protein ligase MARCH2 [Nymphon striatum]|nr:E3 ubiquitin-protein ligase MARCH2 [Nymphon striatum]